MRFAWIDQHKDLFDVNAMCSVLNVSRSGCYAWQKRPPGKKAKKKQELLAKIRKAYGGSRGIYWFIALQVMGKAAEV